MPIFMDLDTEVVRRKSKATIRSIKIAFLIAISTQVLLVWILLSFVWAALACIIPAAIYWLGSRFGNRSWIIRMFGVQETDSVVANRLVKSLSEHAGLTKVPLVAVLNDDRVDSISFPGLVIVTSGVLSLDSLEIEAVLSREVSRIRDGEADVNLVWLLCAHTSEFATKPGTIFAVAGFLLGPASLLLWPLRHELLPRPPRTEIAGALLTSYPPAMVRVLRLAKPGVGVRSTTKSLWLSGSSAKGVDALSEM